MTHERAAGCEGAGYWSGMARHWSRIGPPLRPSPEDARLYTDLARSWRGANGAPRVILLGVTPEIHGLPWPAGTDFLAVDRAQAMIDSVWPGPREAAVCADWRTMTLPAASRDIAFLDGVLNLLTYPQDQQEVAKRLRGILAPGGLCILRLFAPPARRETVEEVIEDLRGGRIAGMSVLKLRLWAALQETASGGVPLADVYLTFRKAVGDIEEFAAAAGWPLEQVLAIDAYRGSPARYHLVTVDEAVGLFCDGSGFRLGEVRVPTYDCGERCPIVVLERTDAD